MTFIIKKPILLTIYANAIFVNFRPFSPIFCPFSVNFTIKCVFFPYFHIKNTSRLLLIFCRRWSTARCGTLPPCGRGFCSRAGRLVAVAGWQLCHSIAGISAVRMVPVRMWQWQYWQSCGSFYFVKKNWLWLGWQWVCFRERQWHREWQWLGGSGAVGKRGSRRFEWYWIECGSGSIGRVAVVFVIFFVKF
jgi:hypothetical protein